MPDESLPRRKLGRTEMTVTRLSLGGAGVGGMRTTDDDDVGVATILRALHRGINLMDTSPFYGRSEYRIGLALRHPDARNAPPLISTKTGQHPARRLDYSGDATRWSVENSLRTLGVDSVDMILIHDPRSVDPVIAPGAALDTLEDLRSEGKLRWIGISDRSHETLRTAIRTGRFDIMLTFGDYNLVRQTALPLLEESSQLGVGTLLAHVFLAGLLAGPDPTERGEARGIPPHLRSDVDSALSWWHWARERGLSLRTLALQFAMRNPLVDTVLVGADNPTQVDEIMKSAAYPIDARIWNEVERKMAAQSPLRPS